MVISFYWYFEMIIFEFVLIVISGRNNLDLNYYLYPIIMEIILQPLTMDSSSQPARATILCGVGSLVVWPTIIIHSSIILPL